MLEEQRPVQQQSSRHTQHKAMNTGSVVVNCHHYINRRSASGPTLDRMAGEQRQHLSTCIGLSSAAADDEQNPDHDDNRDDDDDRAMRLPSRRRIKSTMRQPTVPATTTIIIILRLIITITSRHQLTPQLLDESTVTFHCHTLNQT